MQIRREGLEEVTSSLADVVQKPDRTFKELSRKEKVRFIIDYYKWHIIAGVIALAVIISLINHYAFHNQAIQLYGVGVNVNAPNERLEAVSAEFVEYSSMNTRKFQSVFEYNLFMGSDQPGAGGSDYATVMKLVTLFAAQEVDYMFCDQLVFDDYSRSGGFADLSELLPKDIYGSLLAEGRIVEGTRVDDEESGKSSTFPMAIEITGLPYTQEHQLSPASGDALYMCITSNSKRKTEALNMVRLVLGMEYVPAPAE